MKFTIEVAEDGYQLTGPNGEDSGVTDYGDTAEVTIDGVLHFTTLDEEEEPEEAQIYRMVDGHPELFDQEHEVEEVEFELEADEEEEGDEDGEEEPVEA